MSHTNTTANYNLPQFVGTDKPSWLTDVNGAMTSIDTQMKANADANTTTAGDLSTLSGRVTTAEGNIATQGSTLQTVSNVASNASTTATNASNSITKLTNYFTLNNHQTLSWTCTAGSIGTINTTVNTQTAYNNDGSLGKLYGDISFSVKSSAGATLLSSDTGFRPTSEFTIVGFAFKQDVSDNISISTISPLSIKFRTDGRVEFTLSPYWYNRTANILFVNSLLFITDFGDQPEQ